MGKVKADKFLGALLGAAIGDALGWPNEQNSNKIGKMINSNKVSFQEWKKKSGGKFWSHEDLIKSGEYSDDTQLIIATARSLMYSNWSRHFSKIELPAWLSYERGGGGATKRAADAWRKGKAPWKLEQGKTADVKRYFEAGGNGVAMRILPHVMRNGIEVKELMHQVVLNGIFTHGHPRALIGATLYADALMYIGNYSGTLGYGELVDYLLQRSGVWGDFPNIQKIEEWKRNADSTFKNDYQILWNKVVDETMNLLQSIKEGLELGALDIGNDVLQKIGCFDKKVNGSGTVTAVAAIYLFSKYASNPEIGLIETAHLENADTDTVASMVGALFGMLQGTEWIPTEWYEIQDYKLLESIVSINIDGEDRMINDLREEYIDTSDASFKNKIKNLKLGDCLTIAPFNKLEVIGKVNHQVMTKGISVNTTKMISQQGQTIFIKIYEKTNALEKLNKEAHNVVEVIKNEEIDKKENKEDKEVILNANRLRSFANLLPSNMPIDQYLFLISDIMIELERSKDKKMTAAEITQLKDRWRQFKITNKHINAIVNVLLNY